MSVIRASPCVNAERDFRDVGLPARDEGLKGLCGAATGRLAARESPRMEAMVWPEGGRKGENEDEDEEEEDVVVVVYLVSCAGWMITQPAILARRRDYLSICHRPRVPICWRSTWMEVSLVVEYAAISSL